MMSWWSFFIRILLTCFFVLVCGLSIYFQVNPHYPIPDQTKTYLVWLTYKDTLILLLAALAFYLVVSIFGKPISKVLFRDVHKKNQRVLEEKHLNDFRLAIVELAVSKDEAPSDWKARLDEIKRVLDDMLAQIQKDQVSPNPTLIHQLQVQIEYLERQIDAWLSHENRQTSETKALAPFPDEVNKALAYIDQLLTERSNEVTEESAFEPLPPRRERKPFKKSKRLKPKKNQQLKKNVQKEPLPPRKVAHLPWWRKIKRKTK